MKEIFPRITVNPGVQFGKPVIAGTRVPVDVVVGHFAAGETMEQIADEYNITKDDAKAALLYASKIVGEESLIYNNAFPH